MDSVRLHRRVNAAHHWALSRISFAMACNGTTASVQYARLTPAVINVQLTIGVDGVLPLKLVNVALRMVCLMTCLQLTLLLRELH